MAMAQSWPARQRAASPVVGRRQARGVAQGNPQATDRWRGWQAPYWRLVIWAGAARVERLDSLGSSAPWQADWRLGVQRGQDESVGADFATDASGRVAGRSSPRPTSHSLPLGAPQPGATQPGSRPLNADIDMATPNAPDGIEEFEAFFRRYERQVVACLWRITGDEPTAHDLSQETFVRAWRHFEQIRGYEQPGAWLIRVATHLALNELRRRGSPTAAAERFADDDAHDALSRSDPNLRFAERDLVQQTLLELTPQQRAALVLREVYGFTCEEIGRTLGTSRDAIKMTLWRGREQFRLHYLRKGGSL